MSEEEILKTLEETKAALSAAVGVLGAITAIIGFYLYIKTKVWR